MSGEYHKGLVFKNKKTHLEDSKCNRNLGLDTFSDSVLKFKANAVVDLENGEDDTPYDEEKEGTSDSAEVVSGRKDTFFLKKYSPAELETSCGMALSTVIPTKVSSTETKLKLEAYLQQVFNLSAEKHKYLERKARQIQCPDLVLMCTVISAEGLTAKDANGKSDPYCKMTILPRRHQGTQQVRQKNVSDWQKAGLVEEVLQTTARPETLHPIWNEHFELTIKDPKEDMLVIEVWDNDDEQVGVTKIKGLKGLGNFIADLRKGVDDFMGRAFYVLSTIPTKGERKVLELYSHSSKSKLGTIKIDLRIRGMREHISKEDALLEHKKLTRAVVDFESQKNGHYLRRWDGRLSPSAHELLTMHADSCGINKLQQAGVLLSVLLDYHKSYAVQVSTFCDVIAHIKSCRHHLPEKVLDGQWADRDVPLWVSALFADVHELASYIFDVMKDHLLVFDVKKTQGVRRIESHIIALREMFSFHAFTQKLTDRHKSLRKALEISIMTAVTKAFVFLNSKTEPLRNDPEEHLRAFKGLVLHWLHQTQRCLKGLVPVFKEVEVDYITWYYRALDPLLSSEITWLEKFKATHEDAHTMTFELYLAMRSLSELSEAVEESVRVELKIRKYYLWFAPMVKNWISLARSLCRDRIDKAIAYDKVMQVTDSASFSSSAVDTKGFLLQIGAFWKNLEWPEPTESYSYAALIVQYICDCAVYYVGQVYTRLTDEDIYKDGKFHASEKLCIILNNMCHLQQALAGLSKTLDLETYYKWLEEKDERAATNAQSLITSLLKNAGEDIGNKISITVQQISEKVEIDQFVRKMMISKQEVPDEDTIAPLLDYLTANLQTLGDFLLHSVLWRLLANLWEMSLLSLSGALFTVPNKKGSEYMQARLRFALQMLRDFFYAGGSGITMQDLDIPEYKRLLRDLDLRCLTTPDLVLKFHQDLLDQCKGESEKKSRGVLTVSVAYLQYRKAVEVTVIAAKNLPGLDKSGLSDPFVELSLLPNWLFPDKQAKTSIKKQTVDPLFNEEFLLPVTKPGCMEEEGAILMMAVFDHDKMSSNDLCGLCVLPCNRIPKLMGRGSITSPTGPERKNYHLPLFLVQPTTAYRELEARSQAGDSNAQSFFKNYKSYLDELYVGNTRSRISMRR